MISDEIGYTSDDMTTWTFTSPFSSPTPLESPLPSYSIIPPPREGLYPIGTIVILLKTSKYAHQSGDGFGEVVGYNTDSDHQYRVRWDNRHENSYRQQDIVAVTGRDLEEYKRKQEKNKQERERFKKTIPILKSVDELLRRELKEFHRISRQLPFMYAVGVDDKGIIRKMISIRGYSGCSDLQCISPYELLLTVKEAKRLKVQILGVARVGSFTTDSDQSLGDIRNLNPDFFLLSLSKEKMWISQYMKSQEITVQHEYKIITTKQAKGGE